MSVFGINILPHTALCQAKIAAGTSKKIQGHMVYLQKTKTNNARQILINNYLHGLFEKLKIRQAQPKRNVVGMDGKPVDNRPCKSEYVFNYNGRPVSEVKRSFKKALDDAGIEDFRFHDLRHTFASHMIMRGASIKEVQEILGHRSLTMTMRYAHLSQEHKKKAVNLLNGLTAPSQKPSEEPMSQNVTSSTLIENEPQQESVTY